MALSWSSIRRTIGSAVQPLYGARPAMVLPGKINVATPADRYRVLRAYYHSNSLYDELADLLRRQGVWREDLKALRNPTFRVVEYHAAHLWPGMLPDALPIMGKKRIIEPIQQVWKWSNWGSTKQVAARHLPMYGDLFIKVATTPADNVQRVYFQMLEPEHVTDFDADERDYLTYCRLDVPRTRRLADGKIESYTHTEEWDRDRDSFRVWEHDQGATTDIALLGRPAIEATIASFGIDFVPISHAKFQDVGEDRGNAAIMPAIDKIDEANRQATRLNQMLFRHNNVVWALNGGTDASGRPLPPPRINATDGTNDSNDGTVTFGDEQMLALPGNSELKSLVPELNYAAALAILQDHMRELEQDLPELVSYRLADEASTISGRAVRLLLGPAIARLQEARGNAEVALIRADQMALTLGKYHGLFKSSIGDFDRGDFEHGFEARDVLPTDELERAQAQQADGNALKAYVEAGIAVELAVQELWGWSVERAAQFTKENLAAIQREQVLAQEDTVDEGMVQ